MATKKKIAQSKRGTKRATRTGGKGEQPIPLVPTEQPVDKAIERAAERAGIGMSFDALVKTRVRHMKQAGLAPTQIAENLRGWGAALSEVADTVEGPPPAALDAPPDPAVFRDALEIVNLAEGAFEFESEGLHQTSPENVLRDALCAAKEDLAMVSGGSSGSDHTGAAYRAELRIDLALKIHEFRKKHGGSWRDSFEARERDGEQLAGGAS